MLNKLLTALWAIGTGVTLGVCLAFALTGGVGCTTDAECLDKTGTYYGE